MTLLAQLDYLFLYAILSHTVFFSQHIKGNGIALALLDVTE
jgi:hypothetical protein